MSIRFLLLLLLASVITGSAFAASSASAPAAARRLNALAFDNGTLLTRESGSYSEGLSMWGAWGLTDGSDDIGWCSPSGKPTGASFVWDLDTIWSLETFAISTRNLQESTYPGVSAKAVDLLVGNGGNFTKVGTFNIGREERKEFTLPAGTSAKQIMLVVRANHGNAEFTEIAEVEVFGTRTGTVAAPDIAGDFATNYGPMRITTEGSQVRGCYDWVEGAQIEGAIVGRLAFVTWTEPSGSELRQGRATFAVTPAGALTGVWYENGALVDEWKGPRVQKGERANCQPRKRSQLDALRKEKRLTLYGIQFDSNSDTPRAESGPTLDEVAATMRQDTRLRLLVEGHTDSTNSDAYNLDLSQRRAQRVVAELQKRGIDGGRLKAKGFGRSRPVADNSSVQGRALNRRVEVSVMDSP